MIFLFMKQVFLFQKFLILPVYDCMSTFLVCLTLCSFLESHPPLKKMERKESMYVLNLSKRCEEFVLKWLINKSYIIFLEFQIYLTFLLLCPLQISFSYTVVGKNNSTKRGEMG